VTDSLACRRRSFIKPDKPAY